MKTPFYLVILILAMSCSKHDNAYNDRYNQIIGDWQYKGVENITVYTCSNKNDTSYFAPTTYDQYFSLQKRYVIRAFENGTEVSKSKVDFYNVVGESDAFSFYMDSKSYTGNYSYRMDTIRSDQELAYEKDEFCFNGSEYGKVQVYTRSVYVRK
ncbi:MAG: hypothetical protein HUJ25_08615 [Crocinitomicaceae bacterium]|nr:hypothetical protein [Crocinitomicaceae bacterium]